MTKEEHQRDMERIIKVVEDRDVLLRKRDKVPQLKIQINIQSSKLKSKRNKLKNDASNNLSTDAPLFLKPGKLFRHIHNVVRLEIKRIVVIPLHDQL